MNRDGAKVDLIHEVEEESEINEQRKYKMELQAEIQRLRLRYNMQQPGGNQSAAPTANQEGIKL